MTPGNSGSRSWCTWPRRLVAAHPYWFLPWLSDICPLVASWGHLTQPLHAKITIIKFGLWTVPFILLPSLLCLLLRMIMRKNGLGLICHFPRYPRYQCTGPEWRMWVRQMNILLLTIQSFQPMSRKNKAATKYICIQMGQLPLAKRDDFRCSMTLYRYSFTMKWDGTAQFLSADKSEVMFNSPSYWIGPLPLHIHTDTILRFLSDLSQDSLKTQLRH